MSHSINMIRQILDYIEDYEKEAGNMDLREFSIYLKDKVLGDQPPGSREFRKNDFRNFKSYPEIEFSTLLTSLFRFAKHYIKKAFQNTSLRTLDEFGFLATLLNEESLLKNELIHKHLLEISSGTEILKRLIKNGLVQEALDENDRRAKRVSLTAKGRNEIMTAFTDMHKVSIIILGNLSQPEISEALAVFNKLNYFHHHIHEHDRNSSLDNLFTKYIADYKSTEKI